MTLQCYIDGRELDLDPGTTIRLEHTSPLLDTVLTVGDFSQNIRFPFTGNNKQIFQFAHRREVAQKKLVYDNFEIVDHRLGRIRGSFMLQESIEEQGTGFYEGDFFTALLKQDIFNTPLSEMVSKVVNLGSTTAAIIASAKAQNAAAMSTNGSTGAVMKFPIHRNPGHYGDANPSFSPEADWYDRQGTYEPGEAVKFQRLRYFDNPDVYIALESIAAAQSPATHPAKWHLYNGGILNHWDSDGAAFYINQTIKRGGRFLSNRNALVPWLQVHDIVRDLAATLNLRAIGTYMDDAIEQRRLAFSNFALDARDSYQVLFEMYDDFNDANIGIMVSDGAIYAPAEFPFSPSSIVVSGDAEENDQNELLDEATQLITVAFKGTYRFTGECQLFIPDGGGTSTLWVYLRDAANNNLAFTSYVFPPGSFPAEGIPFAWNVEWDYDYAGADGSATLDIKPAFRTTGASIDPLDPTIFVNPVMELSNLMRQGVNLYSGQVRYADHVPAGTAADYLEALRTLKNLHLDFDLANNVLRLDYADPLLEGSAPQDDLLPLMAGPAKSRTYPKKRYVMEYGVKPSPSQDTFPGYTVVEAVDSFEQLSANILAGYINPSETKAMYIRNLNAWYLTGQSDSNQRHTWVLGGHNYPPLRIEAEGQLERITPRCGPVAMGMLRSQEQHNVLAPYYQGMGRSAGFPLDGQRPPFLMAYWIGIDTSVNADGYPLATTTRYNAAGTAVLTRDMAMLTLFTLHWKRTLQMLVLEERYTALFHLRPDQRQLIDFARVVLMGYVPVIPIRRSEVAGDASKVMEVESRKVKMVALTLINSGENDNPVDLEDINSYYSPYGENGTIQTVTDTTYTLLLSAPYQAFITAVGGELDAGTCSIRAKINGVNVGSVTPIGTTYTQVGHTENNLLLLGDELEIEITSVAGAEMLDFVIKMLLIP